MVSGLSCLNEAAIRLYVDGALRLEDGLFASGDTAMGCIGQTIRKAETPAGERGQRR